MRDRRLYAKKVKEQVTRSPEVPSGGIFRSGGGGVVRLCPHPKPKTTLLLEVQKIMPANPFNGFTEYGIGIGLRAPHYRHILAKKPVVDWFEIIMLTPLRLRVTPRKKSGRHGIVLKYQRIGLNAQRLIVRGLSKRSGAPGIAFTVSHTHDG